MNGLELKASIFTLYDQTPAKTAVDIWTEISNDLDEATPGRYGSLPGRRYRLRINDTEERSPDRRFVRYRTLNAGVRLKRDSPALIDLSLGNWIFDVTKPDIPLATADIPDTRWVRSTTAISLGEHIHWIREFIVDLDEAGWVISEAELTRVNLTAPMIETGAGIRAYDPAGVSRIASQPLWMPRDMLIGLVGLGSKSATIGLSERLAAAWQRLFRSAAPTIIDAIVEPLDAPASATIVVIPNGTDLGARGDLRALLHQWEKDGRRFKLSKQSSTTQQYPIQNLCFDLAVLAGSIPWRPVQEVTPAVSFDAGHDVTNGRSRWASAYINSDLQLKALRALDTQLAEHMPDSAIDAYWPTSPGTAVFRDGRLARERDVLDKRANHEQRTLWEIKKHPVALLYRGNLDEPTGAKYADAAIDPHGEVLLQTLPQGTGDCIHPIRARACGAPAEINELIQGLLAHTAAPSLSMYQQPRLPSVVYWADLASKLDRSGWTQAIGRGLGLGHIVPP